VCLARAPPAPGVPPWVRFLGVGGGLVPLVGGATCGAAFAACSAAMSAKMSSTEAPGGVAAGASLCRVAMARSSSRSASADDFPRLRSLAPSTACAAAASINSCSARLGVWPSPAVNSAMIPLRSSVSRAARSAIALAGPIGLRARRPGNSRPRASRAGGSRPFAIPLTIGFPACFWPVSLPAGVTLMSHLVLIVQRCKAFGQLPM